MAKISRLSKSRLAIMLSKLKVFDDPKVKAEQYPMDSEIGAEVLWNAYINGDILEKVSVDLGCGTGILGIGALILGAKKVYFVDNDQNAINLAKDNLKSIKSEANLEGEAVFLCQDINEGIKESYKESDKNNEKAYIADVVLMNPPFGTKVRHHDRDFLDAAFKAAPLVYSFHKSETKAFVEAFAKDNGFKVSHRYDFSFPLKASYSFHRRRILMIKVSCFRMENGVCRINDC